MAIWQRNLTQIHQEFANALFHYCYIDCQSTFYWMPHLDAWEGVFKTKFKYLSLTEKHELNHEFLHSYDDFVRAIERIREKFAREYNYYFNAIWC